MFTFLRTLMRYPRHVYRCMWLATKTIWLDHAHMAVEFEQTVLWTLSRMFECIDN